MIKSKAIDIISSLDRGEFKEFGKFIRSPYFNENKRLVDLYNLLKTHYPDFSKRSFTKEILYKKLFGSKAYNDGTMRKLLSQFQGAAEEYITYSGIENTGPFQKKLALLHSFDEKKLDKLFSINFKELNVIYKKPANLDDDYFKNNFELEVAGINFMLG